MRVQCNKRIQFLKLIKNFVFHHNIQKLSMNKILQLLKFNKCLEEISMESCSIRWQGLVLRMLKIASFHIIINLSETQFRNQHEYQSNIQDSEIPLDEE